MSVGMGSGLDDLVRRQQAEIERLRAEVARYELLKRAVNESGDCLPTCDSAAHDKRCPNVNMHVALEDQQHEIERLRGLLREARPCVGEGELADRIDAELAEPQA